MTEFDRKYIITKLEHAISWCLETQENLQTQYFGIQAPTFLLSDIHDLALFIASKNISITQQEWQDLYIEASDNARKKFFANRNNE